MSEEALDTPASVSPAELPAGTSQALLLERPVLTAAGQPTAVVILVDIEVKGAT